MFRKWLRRYCSPRMRYSRCRFKRSLACIRMNREDATAIPREAWPERRTTLKLMRIGVRCTRLHKPRVWLCGPAFYIGTVLKELDAR